MSEGQQFVRFNPPPGWPLQPSSQLPPEQWNPPAEWGPAPAGWVFYVDGANRAVPPPLGAWRPGGVGFGGGYAGPDPWAAQTQPHEPWAPGGYQPGPTGAAPGGYPPGAPGGYPPVAAGGYQPVPAGPAPGGPGPAGYVPPGTPGWQPSEPGRRGNQMALIVAGVVVVLLLATGGLLLARRNSSTDPNPTAAPSQTPVTTSQSRPTPPNGAPTTPERTATPAPPAPGTGSATGPELTEAQLRAMLAGHKLGGVDGLYNLRKPNWTPKPTSVEASLPECVTYLSFEAANNTWYAQDTDATAEPTVFLYAYTSAKAKQDQIPLDLACGKALEGKGVGSWVFKGRTKFGDKVDVLTWDSDGVVITEYHYGNLRFAKTGDPDQTFATAVVAQIDAAAK